MSIYFLFRSHVQKPSFTKTSFLYQLKRQKRNIIIISNSS
ncbi:hypothetical protein PEC730217_30090 [Pectobacterium carotovorum subsp. carotovorum]|nr:hypothetical protein PEC106664_07770 [Pectobacterium carotovorum subsp. carotovorum]GKV89592.1 hypothetical protein PEC301619_15740 [Pectobacterium carotovorum subsp. carotovorum]GKW05655.1 hypothetical protein PEC301889_01380 [Pectobacterium carotovorum subsp. carotovorum]GKW34229.1 hypothetical protein PEC730217_30090 [Pectobacterium carotovorum subsp. carotovorum]